MSLKIDTDQRPISSNTDERLDFPAATGLRKSYFVASSYRCGSSYLCWLLWNTGLLGAPSEVFNPTSELPLLINRFKTSSPEDYVTKLLGRRVSRNGVFGVKAHFHHFQAYLGQYPALLARLAPVTYIHINRSDKVAQAVSMAKALQSNRWHSRMEGGPKPTLHYNSEMISKCLADIEQQDLDWKRWFKAHRVSPFHVTYNDLTTDATGVVRNVVELLGVANDEPDHIHVPSVAKQGDETNDEWIERFKRERRPRRAAAGKTKARGLSKPKESSSTSRPLTGFPSSGHFFDRYNELAGSLPSGAASATGFFDLIRLRRRYDVIVGGNRDLFQNSKVLDIMSGHGFWSLAALDAGAAHVVGVEAGAGLVESANKYFAKYKIDPGSYRFVNSELFDELEAADPETFDLVICQGFLEHCDINRFFFQMKRLRPKRVILDTGMVSGEGPIFRFSLGLDGILGLPSHQAIMFLSDAAGFRWRLIDWRAQGLSDWTGIHEYERDYRRTYILDLS